MEDEVGIQQAQLRKAFNSEMHIERQRQTQQAQFELDALRKQLQDNEALQMLNNEALRKQMQSQEMQLARVQSEAQTVLQKKR